MSAVSPWFLALGDATLVPHPAMIAPFVLLLLAIAIMPFLHGRWWSGHYAKVAVGLGAVTVSYYVFWLKNGIRMAHAAQEYASFIALIGSLFVVSGGIHIRVKGEAKPWVNTAFLAIGSLLANIIGTTGASMLLVRPWLRMNRYRVTAFHVVFFIFLVSNVAGSLTPVGDPPLFLGYLRGVPFQWTARHCWPAWGVAVAALLAVFYVLDRRNFLRAPREVRELETGHERFQIDGLRNLLFLVLILLAIFIERPAGLREVLLVAAATLSYFLTPPAVHQANAFNFHPIREVAWLFLGIFATMVPALDYLETHAAALGLDSPAKFYWLAGALSSFLDNAPTYLTFLAAAMGQHQLSIGDSHQVAMFAREHGPELLAISVGSVFFGAMTYIGNGPNFMVKSIAEQAKVNTPTFFGYIIRFSLPFLLPVLAGVAWLLQKL